MGTRQDEPSISLCGDSAYPEAAFDVRGPPRSVHSLDSSAGDKFELTSQQFGVA